MSQINQQQLILILGIVIIILLLIDAYRRSRRKKYKASSTVAHSQDSATDKEDSDQADKKEHKQQEAQSKEQSDNDDQSQSSAETVKEDGEFVSEINETDHQEDQSSDQPSAEENPASETDEAIQSEADDKEAEKEPEPEPKTWEEALAIKRRQQTEARHQKQSDQHEQSARSQANNGDNISTAVKDGIIVIHIMAPRHYVFYGEDLQAVFDHYQLSYNAEIQAYQGISEDGEVLFHVATATKPGTFNINTMDQLQTPGISVFMDIQALSDPKNQFKQMLSLLYKMSENLGGMLLNEYRNRFTQNDVSRIIASIKNIQHGG